MVIFYENNFEVQKNLKVVFDKTTAAVL